MSEAMANPTTPPIAAADVFDGAESSALRDLRTLVLSRSAGISIETEDEERADTLLAQTAKDLDLTLIEWSIAQGMTFHGSGNYVADSQKPAAALKAIDAYVGNAIFVLKDFARHLSEPAISRTLRELLERFSKPPCLSTIVLIDAEVSLPGEIKPMVATLDIKLPDTAEYERAIHSVIESLMLSGRARVEVTPTDFPELTGALRGLTLNQARRAIAQAAVKDGRLSRDDIAHLVELKAGMLEQGGLLEYMPAKAIDAEIGGFANMRKWLERQRMAFGADARAFNLPAPKGVLLVGVQGCGKSLAAKTIANSWQLPLLRLDAGRLYDKFVGESEKNFRQAVSIAESLSPAVLWIDEIEKAMSPSDGGDTDGGLSQRLFGAFLTWLQEKEAGVFVVATANDLSKLPPELLRKGRFDEVFFVDLPDPEERAEIFRIHLSFRRQDPNAFDLTALSAATEGFSGAEIEHVVVTTMLDALQSRVQPDTAAVARVAESVIPLSVSRRDDIERLRAKAREQFVPVR